MTPFPNWTSASPLMKETLLHLLESNPGAEMRDLECELYAALRTIVPHGNPHGFLQELRRVLFGATCFGVRPVLEKARSLTESVEAHSEGQKMNLSRQILLRSSQWIEAQGLDPVRGELREKRLQTTDKKRSLLGEFVLVSSYRFDRERVAKEFLASGARFEDLTPELAEPLPPYLFEPDPSLELPTWFWIRYYEQNRHGWGRDALWRFNKLKELLEPFKVRLLYVNDGP